MHRRRFLGALGGASGAALAGCSDVELEFDQEDTPFEAPQEQLRFLQRHRAVLLYAGGVRMAAAADRAFPDLQSAVFKTPYTYAELSVYRGRVAGYYDAAAWNFARAGLVLSNLGDPDADVGVEACRSARSRAFHLGMGSIYRARATLQERFGGTEKARPVSILEDGGGTEETSTGDDSGGLSTMGTPTEDDDGLSTMGTPTRDDDGLSTMGTPQEDDSGGLSTMGTPTGDDDGMQIAGTPSSDVSGETAAELADAHFQEASGYDIAPVEELRRALGLTG